MIGSVHHQFRSDPINGYHPSTGARSSQSQHHASSETDADTRGSSTEETQLSEDDRQQIQRLKQRDREVRAHERAHLAAGAGLVQGGASFSMQRGPDGRMYAVGGEVSIDTSTERDPDQTIRKMQQVKRAALAPAEPSGTDRAVAAQAGQAEAQARQEKRSQESEAAADDTVDHHPMVPGRQPYHAASVGQAINIDV